MSDHLKRGLIMSIPLLVVAAMIILFASTINRDTSLLPSVMINKPAPEFTLPAIEGIENDIPGFGHQDLVGQVSVVNVFASWCVPCRAEHKFLIELSQTGDVALFGINHKDVPENARQFLTELGNPYDKIGADRVGRISIDWGVYGIPETFVINAQGTIVYKQIGPLDEETFINGLLPAIDMAKSGS